MQTVEIKGVDRNDLGTKYAKLIRKEGSVPCVIYGKDGASHFSIKPLDVRALLYTPDFKLAELTVGKKKYKAILKDAQFHPVTDNLMHVDFLELEDGRSIKVEVPVKFRGESPGVIGGGKLVAQMRKVKIKTTPEHLVDSLYVDISALDLGHAVRVNEIDAIEGIELMSPPNTPVAIIEIPRALKSAATEEAKEGEEGGEESAETPAE
jgi:large subunit ribosomal protein L25